MSESSRLNAPVAFFIPGLNGGGAQKVVVTLANELTKLTDRPIHIVVARGEGEFVHSVHRDVVIVNLDTRRASRTIRALAEYLRRSEPEVLCSSLNYANVCAALAWFLSRRKCRLVLREDSVVQVGAGKRSAQYRRRLLLLLMRWLYPRANKVVAVGDDVAGSLVDYGICRADAICVMNNPVDSSIASKVIWKTRNEWSDFDPYICAVGRLAEPKGFDILLEAFSQLESRDIRLVILGEGPLRQALQEQAAHLGIADRVFMPGFVKRPVDALAAASVFVLSSRWEGSPMVLLEALAVGVPIVASDCPGTPRELLRDGALGHMVPPKDAEALAHALRDAISAPVGSRKERRDRANDFSATSIAQKYLVGAFNLQE